MSAKRGVRALSLLIVLAMVLLGVSSVAFATEAEVTKSVNMREGAGADFDTVTKLKKGAVVTVLDRADEEWWRVSYKDEEGFVSNAYLKVKLPPPEPGYTGRNTQLRASTDVSGKVVTAIPINTNVTILDSSDKLWWLVSYEEQEGYVQAVALKKGEAPSGTSATTPDSQLTMSANDPNADKIAKAKKINGDVVGWIDVPNTNVDDPILFGPNFYYSNRNLYKKKSLEGVYPYVNRLTRNVVIFGHNLRNSNGGMHQLHHLQEAANGRSSCQYGKCGRSIGSLKNWHTSSKGRVWNISIFGKSQWEVFAMYEVPRNEPIATLRSNWNVNASSQDSWVAKQVARSEVDFGVSVSSRDQIMTIITCGTNYDSATANSRLFFFLKCVG